MGEAITTMPSGAFGAGILLVVVVLALGGIYHILSKVKHSIKGDLVVSEKPHPLVEKPKGVFAKLKATDSFTPSSVNRFLKDTGCRDYGRWVLTLSCETNRTLHSKTVVGSLKKLAAMPHKIKHRFRDGKGHVEIWENSAKVVSIKKA